MKLFSKYFFCFIFVFFLDNFLISQEISKIFERQNSLDRKSTFKYKNNEQKIFNLDDSIEILDKEEKENNNILNVDYAIKTTVKNNEQIKLASQELEVLESKVIESKRNIFPNLALKAEKTKGIAEPKSGVPGFKEENYSTQLNWNIFEGGKISALYNQSKLNWTIGTLKLEKTIQDLVYNTKEAYWNYKKFILSLEFYDSASIEVKKYYEMAQKMYFSNNISKKELLNSESQYNQSLYQIETTKVDIESQLWILLESMGLYSLPEKLEMPTTNLDFKVLNFSIEKCLDLANKYNPDIQTQKIMIEINEYNKKIKNSYKLPKLSFQSSYGKSGGAYNSENLNLKEDYYAGIQLSQVISLNTLTFSDINQKTSPKVGQSSRSESHTNSLQLNILDNYKQKSEKKEADLAYDQTIYNLKKTRFSVESEIRKAFTNYKKALIQIKNAQLELDILKKELEISKLTLGTDKTTFEDITSAINKYASGQVALVEAKIFYLISIAALEKAVGVEDLNIYAN